MNAPKPVPVEQQAAAAAKANKETAITQYELGATEEVTPYGEVRYKQLGTSEAGNPQYERTVTLNPEEQRLLDLQRAGFTSLGEAGVDQAGRVKESLGTPFDISAGRARELTDIHKNFLDPEWGARAEALESDLLNKGIRAGSPAYTKAHADFENQKARAYDQMFLDAYGATNAAALQERRLPLEELNLLLRGTTGTVTPEKAPDPGVAPVDLASMYASNLAAQTSQYNAMLGGIAGVAGAGLGGWARGGFPMPA